MSRNKPQSPHTHLSYLFVYVEVENGEEEDIRPALSRWFLLIPFFKILTAINFYLSKIFFSPSLQSCDSQLQDLHTHISTWLLFLPPWCMCLQRWGYRGSQWLLCTNLQCRTVTEISRTWSFWSAPLFYMALVFIFLGTNSKLQPMPIKDHSSWGTHSNKLLPSYPPPNTFSWINFCPLWWF